jgi:hypothetical protein
MPNKFSSGKYAIAQCDRCSFRFKLSKLRTLVIKTKNVNIRVCPECFEADHPQLKLGMFPVNDPQAVRNPRPDTSYPESRAYVEPLYVGAGISFSVGVINDLGNAPPQVSTGYFAGGLFSGGLFSGGFFSTSSSYTPPTPPVSTGFFSGGMFSGGMFASQYF